MVSVTFLLLVKSLYHLHTRIITTPIRTESVTERCMTETVDPRETRCELVAKIERRDAKPDLCTIYQPHTDEMSQMATWITAKEGSFIDLERSR